MAQTLEPPEPWPELAVPGWEDTEATLHLWTQMVGKTRLALSPMLNHWWQVPLYVTSRGLGTSLMHQDNDAFELDFDFVEHRLGGRSASGKTASLPLRSQPVATFYEGFRSLLQELGISVHLWTRPVEIPVAIPFEQDKTHFAYDPLWANRFWRALVSADRVLKRFRAGFVGKASPVHFFWGGFDLAVTRFSGRHAPQHPGGIVNCPDWVMHEAYSQEVSSAGFWPGSAAATQAAFYSYAYPEPPGFAGAPVRPEAARYESALGEFVLPYEAVRRASNPDEALMEFLQSTYDAAAELAGWDRAHLERPIEEAREGEAVVGQVH
jgi:hypothetical protein